MSDGLVNNDIEAQVLGTLIRAGEKGNRDLVFEADAILRTAEVFAGRQRDVPGSYSKIYSAIVEIAKGGAPPTRTNIADHLQSKFDVAAIADAVVSSNHETFLFAVERVAELYRARLVRAILANATTDVQRGDDAEGVAREVSGLLLRAIERQQGNGGTIGAILDRWESRQREKLTDVESDWYVEWGIWCIDKKIGRLIRGGHFIAVGAHTKVGKTVVATDLVRANGLRGELKPVVIELEMLEEDMLERMISAEGEIPYEQVRDNAINPHYFGALQVTKELIRRRTDGAWLEHIPSGQLRDVVARIRTHVAQYRTRLVIVDYIQIIDTPKGHSRQTEVADIVKALKRLAMELKITIVGMCQLNDEIQKRSGDYRRPLSTDTREAKDIEKDADCVVLIDRPLHRKDSAFWDGVPAQKMYRFPGATREIPIEIARIDFHRVRRGEEFYKDVWWQGEFQRFAELPGDFHLPSPVFGVNDNEVW